MSGEEARGKICRRCHRFCHFDKFKITGRKLSGKVYYKGVCASCVSIEASDVRALRRIYGMPLSGVPCDCCGRTSRLVIDHCHDTGGFRGYLCQQCNIGLGNLGDNQEGLLRAIRYLSKDAAAPRGGEVGVRASA